MRHSQLFLLFLCLFFTVAGAQESQNSKAELISEARKIAPGSTFSVALKLEHPENWHSYYRNSGGIELAPSIQWTLPEGFDVGPIQWPTPEVKDGYFGKSFIYPGSPVFLVDIKAPASLEIGKTITFSAKASWQICKESCRNENASFTLTLPVGTAMEKNPLVAEVFKTARIAQPATVAWKFTAQSAGGEVILRAQPNGTLGENPLDFIPDQPFIQSASSGGSIQRDGDGWSIRLKRAEKDSLDNKIPQGKFISGILIGSRPIRVPETIISQAPPASLSFASFLPILGGMLLGGLLLNLMPCVFPVIGLKIMGFVQQAGSNRRKIALHGVTFALGVLASFGVLSAILFTARASTGWGYQLQNPWVVFVLMLLMFALALNLFGVFEIGTSATSVGGSLQAKQGLIGSFFSGVLATVVATPCSGPFLGVAIGAAFALPAVQFFSAFAAMAIGLALPYLVLSIFPSLLDYLPRPGAWMESFKQGMSFLLFATTGYLLWVYSGLIDVENLLGPIFGLSTIAAAGWIYGRWYLPHRSKKSRMVALVLTAFMTLTGVLLAKPPKPSALTWEPWSEARVQTLLTENKPVYIDFTAKWCATCQLNKKRAYTEEVVDLMRKKGVITLRADKTQPNPEIEAALNRLGRSAIPVNVLLQPGKEPLILPELLSAAALLDALKNL